MTPLPDEIATDAGASALRTPSHSQAIADVISKTYKSQYGKGPEGIRVHVNADTVTALLRGGFSIVEESLRSGGRAEEVRDQRRAFGDLVAPALGTAVAAIVGREVVAVLADTCQDPDLCAIVLVLSPSDR